MTKCMEEIQNIQEIPGMFEDGFFVNTSVTEFIDAILSAPGNLIEAEELKDPITISQGLCIRISKLSYINDKISDSPIKDKCFYVNIGILNFIYRVLTIDKQMRTQITDTMSKKDYLIKMSEHSLICSVITKICSASEKPKEQESMVAERCWIVGEIENAEVRNAAFLQVKYKVNGVICKCTIDIDEWNSNNIVKRCEVIAEILNIPNFEGFVKDENSIELLTKIKKLKNE